MRRGTLIREHRGVYRVGHRAPSVLARYLAAVRACGEGAAAERARGRPPTSASLKGPAPQPEVTVPTKRRVKGVRTRRARR